MTKIMHVTLCFVYGIFMNFGEKITILQRQVIIDKKIGLVSKLICYMTGKPLE